MTNFVVKSIFIAILLAAITPKDYTIADFKKNYFKIITATKGFYEVKAGFENVNNEIIINTGFVNKDLYADIITVTKDRTAGHFYIYDDEANTFKLNMVTPSLPNEEKILTIKLTQIKSQGSYPDVVVITQFKSDGAITTRFRGYSIDNVSSGNYTYSMTPIDSYFIENINITSDKSQEPFNIQMFEGNRLIDYWLLMKNGVRVLYYYNQSTNKSETKDFMDIIDQECRDCEKLDEISNKAIPQTYTSAYIDINRDCRSDIVIESHDPNSGDRFLEFYYYMNSKFGLIKVVPIPKTYSLGVVEDINENNNPDLLFVDKSNGKLMIYLNNYSVADKKSDFYCSQSVSTQFMYPSLINPEDKTHLLTQELVSNAKLYEDVNAGIHGFIKLGDLDLDSYKDLILNMTVNGKNDVYIFLNRPCELNHAKDIGVDTSLCRYFDAKAVSDEDIAVMKDRNAIESVYFDLGERG